MAKKESTAEAPAVVETNLPGISDSAWGASESNEASDLLVSKLFHQQAISKQVSEGNAAAGDWCDSVTGEVVCKKDSPLQILVFHSKKNLLRSKLDTERGKYKWFRTEDLTPENANLPFKEDTPEGSFMNQIQYNFFCLLVGKVEEMPYVLSLSSTKTRTAKKLNTMFQKLARLKKPSASLVIELTSVKESNESGSWLGLEVKAGRSATADELKIAFDWYQTLKTSKVRVHEGEDEPAASQAAGDDSDIPF